MTNPETCRHRVLRAWFDINLQPHIVCSSCDTDCTDKSNHVGKTYDDLRHGRPAFPARGACGEARARGQGAVRSPVLAQAGQTFNVLLGEIFAPRLCSGRKDVAFRSANPAVPACRITRTPRVDPAQRRTSSHRAPMALVCRPNLFADSSRAKMPTVHFGPSAPRRPWRSMESARRKSASALG